MNFQRFAEKFGYRGRSEEKSKSSLKLENFHPKSQGRERREEHMTSFYNPQPADCLGTEEPVIVDNDSSIRIISFQNLFGDATVEKT